LIVRRLFVAKRAPERTHADGESRSRGDRRTRCHRGCSFVKPAVRRLVRIEGKQSCEVACHVLGPARRVA
jgi:hypothetical protein